MRWRHSCRSLSAGTVKGFSLIEVLVSLLLLSFILLSFDATQLFAMRKNRDAYFHTLAVNQLSSFSELLKILQGHEALIPHQLAIWNEQNKKMLPYGKGEIKEGFIIVSWGESHENQAKWRHIN